MSLPFGKVVQSALRFLWHQRLMLFMMIVVICFILTLIQELTLAGYTIDSAAVVARGIIKGKEGLYRYGKDNRTRGATGTPISEELRSHYKMVFNSGHWRSSTVSYAHHVHFQVNCSGIIRGDHGATDDASQLMYFAEKRGHFRPPSDDLVTAWTKNCEFYKWERRYPAKPASGEEAKYPIAYIILASKDSAQVERLLRAIYHPQNVYCVHPDARVSAEFMNAVYGLSRCFDDNVFIASRLESVLYRGIGRLRAEINCMEDLASDRWRHRWNYVINLSEKDFPLKTNLEIVRQIKAYRGLNDIPGVLPIQNNWFVGRTRNHHHFQNGVFTRTDIVKPPPPHDAIIYFGNAFYVASKHFVEYILTNKTAQDILYYLADSDRPEEHYWVTMNRYPGAAGGYPYSSWNTTARFVRWSDSKEHPPCIGKYVQEVCVIGFGYLPYLSAQPHLFVNSVHYDFDPLTIQCLEEILDYRTIYPDAISDFVSGFPVTNLFRNTSLPT